LCRTQVKLLLEVFSFPIVARFQVVSCHYFNMYLLFMRSSIIWTRSFKNWPKSQSNRT
jgi:hypothetical protein